MLWPSCSISIYQPDAEQNDAAAGKRGKSDRLAEDDRGDDHGDQRLNVEKNTCLCSGQPLQRVVPRDVCQARAEHTEEGNANPAAYCELADFANSVSAEEDYGRKSPAQRHHEKHHARRRVILEAAPREHREDCPVDSADQDEKIARGAKPATEN